ncbi:MAG: folate-binding protein [Nitrosomonas sp.]|nr:folate-binding protein [Nitrosomonas sp.]MDP1951731.1 folate-binding protein [Nitrosomonas sp.]
MNPTWQSFLQSRHAVIENGCITHFGNITTELKNAQLNTIIVDLSHLGLIRFSGEDALTFLQGQLTCDVKKVDHQTAQYGSYCTPKGRMLASFLLWQHHHDYLMQLPLGLCNIIQKRLFLFVLRAKVKLTDSSDSLIRIGIAGNDASKLIEEILDTKLDSISQLSSIHNEQLSIFCHAKNRFELVTTTEKAPALWLELSKYANPAGVACWDWLEIRSGFPVILPATQDQFIPQMTNLDIIGGVSLQKGCYPGQEIVARTRYLGKIKRRMHLANIPTTLPVMAGDELFSADMGEQSSGRIVNAAVSPTGGFDVLAVIQLKSVEAGRIHWKALDGPKLEIISLPYSLD